MLKKLLLISVLLLPKLLFGQGTIIKNELTDNFAWEVKQIDEFIERFNNTDSTLIQTYIVKNKAAALTRTNLIKSLFNFSRPDWNFSELNMFLTQVTSKNSPTFISFFDDKWYANVNCSVIWDGKPKTVMLKLKVLRQGSSTKWAIYDADAKFLSEGKSDIPQPVIPKAVDENAFLNPMSHSLNFFNLDMVSIDTKNIANYIYPQGQYSADFSSFITQCLNHRIKIVSVKNVTYSFLQIKGWDMEIKQFNRSTKNSGWLIDKLVKLPS